MVEDLIDQEGTRSYLHIIGFTNGLIADVHSFITEGRVGLYPLRNNIKMLHVATTDYEFENPTDTSRILVEFVLEPDSEWSVQGTRRNCDAIWNTVLTRLGPNM